MKNPFSLISSLVVLLASSFPLVAAEQEAEVFSQAEIDQMLAPIALYPDVLLAQILTASTYPLEIVEAARWSRNNPGMEGAEATEAVAEMDWDPSVKALVAFPQVLARMDEDLTWTRRLGDAFLIQEEEVMASIQDLRERAYAAGNLDSLEHVRVQREEKIIVIEPANPQIVYVPYYRPTVIYGSWWWPAYPPVYWGAPVYYHSYYSGSGIFWTSGIRIHSGFFFARFDWPRRHIVVVHHHHHHHHQAVRVRHSSGAIHTTHVAGERWRHNPEHRRGVAYRSESVAARHGRSTASGQIDSPRSWSETHTARRTSGDTVRRSGGFERESSRGSFRRDDPRQVERTAARLSESSRARGSVTRDSAVTSRTPSVSRSSPPIRFEDPRAASRERSVAAVAASRSASVRSSADRAENRTSPAGSRVSPEVAARFRERTTRVEDRRSAPSVAPAPREERPGAGDERRSSRIQSRGSSGDPSSDANAHRRARSNWGGPGSTRAEGSQRSSRTQRPERRSVRSAEDGSASAESGRRGRSSG